MNVRIVRIDKHIIVSCPPQVALACLDGPTTITGWFGGHRHGARTTFASRAGVLVIERSQEEWLPDVGAFLLAGTTGDLWFRAHLTVRAVMRPGAYAYVHSGTEIATHVELGPADRALLASTVIQDVIHHGLDHIRLELDTS